MTVLLAKGKTKEIYRAGPGTVLIVNHDDITAGNGARHHVIPGKGASSTEVAANCFRYLKRIPTHFLGQESPTAFKAHQLQMIPLEVVVRAYAAGSYLKRHPKASNGDPLAPPVVETYLKNDQMGDPLVVVRGDELLYYDPNRPPEEGFLSRELLRESPIGNLDAANRVHLTDLAYSAFNALREAWRRVDVVLVDAKFEFGFDATTGQIKLGDVVDADSTRLWLEGDPERALDKQVYRDADMSTPEKESEALALVASNYRLAAELSRQFGV